MRYAIIAAAVLTIAVLNTPALADAAATGTASATTAHTAKANSTVRKASAPQSNEVTYDRDSKDPNVGWHTQNGMRVCTEDCDNPEIPGSGYTCKNVQVLGMAMRQCTESNW
jgi:hypothetical protein